MSELAQVVAGAPETQGLGSRLFLANRVVYVLACSESRVFHYRRTL